MNDLSSERIGLGPFTSWPEHRPRTTGPLRRQLLNFSMSGLLGPRSRGAILRRLGLQIARDAQVCRGTRLGGINIVFATGAKCNEECWIDDNVTLQRNARLGSRVQIITGTHDIGPATQRRGWADVSRPVVIGEGCWIESGAIIQPGAHIAAGCVVCPGAVVTKPTKPHALYAGVPAVRIRELEHGTDALSEGGPGTPSRRGVERRQRVRRSLPAGLPIAAPTCEDAAAPHLGATASR